MVIRLKFKILIAFFYIRLHISKTLVQLPDTTCSKYRQQRRRLTPRLLTSKGSTYETSALNLGGHLAAYPQN